LKKSKARFTLAGDTSSPEESLAICSTIALTLRPRFFCTSASIAGSS
jgi:hypothetical protein